MDKTPNYVCVHCGKKEYRDSTKKWVQSYCETHGLNVKLQRIK